MASLDEFKEIYKTQAEFSEDDDDDDDLLDTIKTSMDLMDRVRNLLNYLGDPELIKTISSRERTNIHKVSEQLREWLVETDADLFSSD